MRCTSPGGAVPLLDAAGKDGTKLFYSLHRGSVLDRYVFRVEQCSNVQCSRLNNKNNRRVVKVCC